MKQKILIFLIGIILLTGFVAVKEAKAGAGDNVWGWAWAGVPQAVPPEKLGIGWISFNSSDCDPNGDGNPADGPAECVESGRNYSINPIPNYGVNIDPATGNFSNSSYAWSNNIGWIWFASTDIPPGETSSNPARLTGTTVSGWARACAGAANTTDCTGGTNPAAGGWDGWIKLRGLTNEATPQEYGVSLNTGPDPDEFTGWAWGSDVVGWISFNCSNQGVCSAPTGEGGPSNYKVMTNINRAPNQPTTNPNESWGYCGGTPSVNTRTTITLNWVYSDPDDVPPGIDPQTAYEIWVDDDINFTGTKFNNLVDPGSSQSYILDLNQDDNSDWLTNLGWGTTYYWKVMVKDSNGNWSIFSDANSFTMPSAQAPNPIFSASSSNPRVGEVVTFTDTSLCYTGFTNCKDDGNTSYLWDFGDDATSDFKPITTDATHDYSSTGLKTVWLRVTDLIGTDWRACSEDLTLGVKFPLPKWKEIPPF